MASCNNTTTMAVSFVTPYAQRTRVHEVGRPRVPAKFFLTFITYVQNVVFITVHARVKQAMSFVCLFVRLSIYLYIYLHLSNVFPPLYLSTCLSTCVSIHLSFHLCVCDPRGDGSSHSVITCMYVCAEHMCKQRYV